MHPVFNHILDLVYPHVCIACQKTNANKQFYLCFSCLQGMPFVGDYAKDNPTEKLFWGRFSFGFAYSLLYFQKNNIAQHLMHALKYRAELEAGEYIGQQLGKQLLQISDTVDDNILLPVPLSAQRLAQRGYNQAEVIANGIHTVTGIPIANQNILRIKNTETQIRKSRVERYNNMMQAFEIDNAQQIQGKHVIIVDDTITTGATIESCALAVLQVPKVKVSVVCGAIASN
jgi:ComF family protein